MKMLRVGSIRGARYLWLLTLLLLNSCKKEIVSQYDDKSDHLIKSFKIQTGNEFIYAHLDPEAQLIEVYLPYFYTLDYLEPLIQLSEGARISPAATEMIPVFDEHKFKYTVTGASGKQSNYQVKIIIQQPSLVLEELSTAWGFRQ